MNRRIKIKFTEYRYLLEAFERIVNVDYHACVGKAEKGYWCDRAGRAFTAIDNKTCCKPELMERFERTADRSTGYITTIRGNE